MSLFYLPSQEVIVSRVWRLSTKHSKAMKNGRLFIELGKGTNSDYQMTIINAQITSMCLVFFTVRISNFFPILVNFFQRHAPLAQSVEQQPFKLLVRGSNPRRGTMGGLTSILSVSGVTGGPPTIISGPPPWQGTPMVREQPAKLVPVGSTPTSTSSK